MASLATSVGAEPSVRFAIDYAEEQPKISDACKNFLAYRIAQAKTDANASPADADRAVRMVRAAKIHRILRPSPRARF